MAEDRETAARIAAVRVDAAARGLKISGSVLDIIADIRAQGAAAQQPEPAAPPTAKPAGRVSPFQIRKIAAAYKKQRKGLSSSKVEFEKFARDNGVPEGHSTVVRNAYLAVYPERRGRPGRPRK
jgi:hypothetical protein